MSELRDCVATKAALTFPPVSVSEEHASTIAEGFRTPARNSNDTVWACSIIPEYPHLVPARHVYHVERMVNRLKDACTAEMMKVGDHPLKSNVSPADSPSRM